MSKSAKRPSYKNSDFGDNYDKKDPVKVSAIRVASSTAYNLQDLGFAEVALCRGESTHVIDMGSFYLASNPEGLGTKNLIADALSLTHPKNHYYRSLAKDTVASIVNDVITVGARPLVVNAHWSMGDNKWLENSKRWNDLVQGWTDACTQAGAIYGAGESPTLRGLIVPGKIELSGSVVGIINPKKRLTLGKKLRVGDHIILIESNGLQTNGASMARGLVEKLPKSYDTKLPSGETIGEALLHPSHIYAKLTEALFKEGVDIHYMVHMTGHGWSKLMRYAEREFTYRMHALPDVQEEFSFLQKIGNIRNEDMYSAFNMGTGFAFYVPEKDVVTLQKIAKKVGGFGSWDAGVVEKGPRRVIIEPLNITYGRETLKLR